MSWAARWAPALVVALGAAVATAHGLYEVAHASKVPAPIAWLYPLVTDGLAMVAYSATGRLSGRAAGYAWTCVVVAAGLSGLAQAVYLAADTVVADPVVRFGVGAWPAIACALVAHLLHLILATDHQHGERSEHGRGVRDDVASASDTEQHLAPPPALVAPAAEAAPVAAHDDGQNGARDDGGDEQQPVDEPGPDEVAGDGSTDGDARVRLLGELLTAGVDVTGPQAAALLSHQAGAPVSDRTARRLLAAARDTTSDTSHETEQDAEQPPARRARLVLLPTGTSTTSTTSTDTGSATNTDQGDPR